MDHYLDSCNTEKKTVNKVFRVIELQWKDGFILISWITTKREVLSTVRPVFELLGFDATFTIQGEIIISNMP